MLNYIIYTAGALSAIGVVYYLFVNIILASEESRFIENGKKE
ncbi:hypothetical protein [Shewanella avicenniae]|nr:hypothetical protein [Shewanella avicenniae]